jgi:hypothetical protein
MRCTCDRPPAECVCVPSCCAFQSCLSGPVIFAPDKDDVFCIRHGERIGGLFLPPGTTMGQARTMWKRLNIPYASST